MAEIKGVLEALTELEQDTAVPRNIKDRITKTIGTLQSDCEVSMKVDKALQELDEIADDINLQPYTRTQIWNIVSMLEKI